MPSKHVPVEGKDFGVQVGCSIIHIHDICIQLYTHTCAHMHKHMHIHTFTYSHKHMHTSTHTYTPMHPGKHIGTCADIHIRIFHLRNHWHIGKPHENPPKKCLQFSSHEIHDGHHSEVQRPRWCGSSTHFPKMEKSFSNLFFEKGHDFRKFSEMILKW